MYVKVLHPEGTEMLFDCGKGEVIEHAVEAEPGRFMIVVVKENGIEYQVKSKKDLRIYVMNDRGKTVDRKFYRQ